MDANQSACHFYGWPLEVLCTMFIHEINQLPLDQVVAERAAALREKRGYFIFPHRLANGETRMVEVHSTPVTINEKNILVSIIHDITQRLRDAEQLDNLLREQHAILHSRIVGIVKLKELKFVWVNAAFADMLGYATGEMIDLPFSVIFPSEDSYATFAGAAYPVMQQGEVFRTEIQYLQKEGTLGWYEVSGTLLSHATQESIWAIINISERKRIELALKTESGKNQKLLQNASDGIHILAPDGNLIESSNSFNLMLGYQHEEIIGKNVAQWDAQFSDTEIQQILQEQIKKQGLFQFETRHRHKDGSIFDVEVSCFPLELDGNPVLFCSSRDITARKLTEATLFFHSNILNSVMEGIFLIRADDGKIVFTNPQFDKMFDYESGELLGLHVSVINAHNDKTPLATAQMIMSELERTGNWSGEIEHVKKDGTQFWSSAKVSTFIHPKFGLVWVSAHEDITERKKSEEALLISATAFEVQTGMIITDANSRVIRVNKAFTDITGYSSEEVIGKNPRILGSGRQGQAFYAGMWASINNYGNWSGEIWNRRKSGEIYPEHLTITAVKNTAGNVSNYVASLSDISLRKAAEDQIKHLAFYDPLTHLPNRRLLIDRLQQAFASRARTGSTGAVLFIDLDDFKTLNDTLGHDIGDLLLQQVAKRLESCMREGDTVARLGGDEFVVMLEGLNGNSLEAATQTEIVGNKILALLNQPYQLAGHEFINTPSIGAALFSADTQSIDELMKQADIAMYQSKKAGRNTLRFFDPKMQENINVRAALEGELRKALDKHQFQLYYQIQVDSIQADGARRTLGAEALIRWMHPERGVVCPAEFIPMAEDNGMIHPIGLWVLDTACAQLKSWEQNAFTRQLTLAVNVSAKHFRLPGFVAQVKAALQRHSINPRLLKLELTESLLLEDIADSILAMNELNSIGVQFSLDDFGTGYSSLQYLKRLPLNQLKIDQSFVRELPTDSSDRAIVSTIIAMAKSLNLHIIAEGVETEEQRQILENAGCKNYQGYLFSKPLPIEQFESLLKDGFR